MEAGGEHGCFGNFSPQCREGCALSGIRLGRAFRVFLLAGILCSTFSHAQISLNISADTTARPPDLNVQIVVTNIGNEAAHDVQITLKTEKETATLPGRSLLAPNASAEVQSTLSIEETVLGRHPLFVTVGYADTNGYPFSAILCATFFIEKDTSSDIFGMMSTEPLAESGRLYLQLKNVGQEEVGFRTNIFTPREVSVGDYEREMQLSPGRETSFEVPIHNFSALPGSRYPVYAVVEYEKEDIHYTNVISGQVEIIASISFFTRYRSWIVGIAGVLFLIGILCLITRSYSLSGEQDEKGKIT